MKKNLLKSITICLLVILVTSCTREEDELPSSVACQELGGEYNSNLTLTNRSSDPSVADYCVTSNMQITDGAALIIEPGVKIEFSPGTNLQLGLYSTGFDPGYINANGTEEQPIVFTGTESTPGIWRGISVGIYADDVRNSLNHCIIEYAGANSDGYGLFVGGGSGGGSGLISLTNSEIRYTQGSGFLTSGDNCINNFSNNHFHSNNGPAIEINPQDFSHIDESTTYQDNLPNGVYGLSGAFADEISDGQIHSWSKLPANAAYYVNEKIDLFSNTRLIIEPGVDIVMNTNDAKFQVVYNSTTSIKANGTAAEPITIRGANVGAVSWEGINLVDDTDNEFTYCNISEAGFSTIGHSGCNSQELTTFNIGNCGRATIQNCNISNSGGCGIVVATTNTTNLIESDNTFTNMTDGNICN